MNLFVTVGTTRFDALIEQVHNPRFFNLIEKKGFRSLTIQYGHSPLPPAAIPPHLSVTTYAFKPTLLPDFKQADLVVSSGGAGTILEVLELGKGLSSSERRFIGSHQFLSAR